MNSQLQKMGVWLAVFALFVAPLAATPGCCEASANSHSCCGAEMPADGPSSGCTPGVVLCQGPVDSSVLTEPTRDQNDSGADHALCLLVGLEVAAPSLQSSGLILHTFITADTSLVDPTEIALPPPLHLV